MKHLNLLALAALLAGAISTQFPSASAQLPSETPEEKLSKVTLAAVLEQQKTISDNQAKIDEKLAKIAENVRLARLFQSRAK